MNELNGHVVAKVLVALNKTSPTSSCLPHYIMPGFHSGSTRVNETNDDDDLFFNPPIDRSCHNTIVFDPSICLSAKTSTLAIIIF